MSFKNEATKHQNEFFTSEDRQDVINPSRQRAQPHWLNEKAASDGKNFYAGYNVFGKAKKQRGAKRDVPEWFLDTLRSQHIPFNLFIPLSEEKEFAKTLFNSLYNLSVTSMENIYIEYPPNKLNPLNDHTSFDAFVDYKSNDKKGFIAFEVKYTESGYSPSEKELEWIKEASSTYSKVTKECDMFLEDKIQFLKDNSYRQIWRNHLLAIEWARVHEYDEFLFVTLFPKGNKYIGTSMHEYQQFLKPGNSSVSSTTYEEFLEKGLEIASTESQTLWINYLKKRYIID